MFIYKLRQKLLIINSLHFYKAQFTYKYHTKNVHLKRAANISF